MKRFYYARKEKELQGHQPRDGEERINRRRPLNKRVSLLPEMKDKVIEGIPYLQAQKYECKLNGISESPDISLFELHVL